MKAITGIYLDTSVYNRPFDDQYQTRVRLETEAFLLILEKAGIEPIDALHFACAESGADFFVTCDDGIIKKVRKNSTMFNIEVCNPLEFVVK